MITITTIGITIDAALARGISGQQAINLLRAISEEINLAHQIEELEAEAEAGAKRDEDFLKALGPPPGTPDDGLCPACGDDVAEPADGGWYCLACGTRWT